MTTPVCDLILLSWNHLDQTQPCLESLFQSTQAVPCRLIIVDNGSEPHVREFLRSVKPAGAIQEVILLQNDKNEGFPAGMNRGIRESRAPYVCLLNNDLIFTPLWLSKMIQVAEAHPEIGVLNPASSTFGDYPPPGSSLEAYAQYLEVKRGLYVEVGMCIGFCMLIKRKVIDAVGLLTEEVERIFFEDEDYCMRAKVAGYQCVVVSGSYVHHAEHKTVTKMPEREALFSRNQQWCHEKWGRWLRIAVPRSTEIRLDDPVLPDWLRQLVAWVRERTHVYVYAPMAMKVSKEELFRAVGLVPHADIHWHTVPTNFSRLSAAAAILKRRKKPFHAIIAPDAQWETQMRRLQWLHGAQVIPTANANGLEQLWTARFPSRSSS